MSYVIEDGWVRGEIPGPSGPVPVRTFADGPFVRRPSDSKRNLVLHTTEADRFIPDLRYPSEWQVGEIEGRSVVAQHKPLWAIGDAVLNHDRDSVQIEIQGRTKLIRWLPSRPIFDALVSLMAFLHSGGYVRTALERPTLTWPVRVDYRGDAYPATAGYYRRHAGLWPHTPGVYGHIEIPDNDHHDPGGLDYPQLFHAVRGVLDDMSLEDYIDGEQSFRESLRTQGTDPGDPPASKPKHFKAGWSSARFGSNHPKGDGDGTAPTPPHTHQVTVSPA